MGFQRSQSDEIEALLVRAEDNALFRARPKDVLKYASEALKESIRAKDAHSLARSEVTLGMYELDHCSYEKALTLSRKAYVTFERIGDVHRSVASLQFIGTAQMLLERYDESFESFSLALNSNLQTTNRTTRGILFHNLSNLLLARGDFYGSLAYSQESLRLLEGSDARVIPFVLYNIASIANMLGNDKRTQDCLDKAEELVRNAIGQDNYNSLGSSPFDLKLLADILSMRSNHAEAGKLYAQANGLLEQFNFSFTEAEGLMDLGKSASASYDLETATEYFADANRLALRVGNKGLIARSQLLSSELFQKSEQYSRAEQALSRVLAHARTMGNALLQLNALERLAKVHEDQKNHQSAARLYKQANELLRRSSSSKPKAVFLLGGNDADDRETELNHAERNLQAKSQENAALRSRLQAQDALLLTLRDKLGQVLAASGDSRTVALREVIESLENHLDTQTQQDELKDKLKTLNQSFILNLSKHYPSLSASEVEVCSLISLGLSAEDIEETLMISSRTLENYRFRIRKKLRLHRKERLEHKIAVLKEM